MDTTMVQQQGISLWPTYANSTEFSWELWEATVHNGWHAKEYMQKCYILTAVAKQICFPRAWFSKNLTTNLWKTYEKVWLMKNLGWACDFQKNLTKILWKT